MYDGERLAIDRHVHAGRDGSATTWIRGVSVVTVTAAAAIARNDQRSEQEGREISAHCSSLLMNLKPGRQI
jgi:hypothetical protein